MQTPPPSEPTSAILLEDGAIISLVPNTANTRLVLQILNTPFDFETVTLHPAEILQLIEALTADLQRLHPSTHIV